MKKHSERNTGNLPRTGAQCVVEGLSAAGCDTLFGYPGGFVLDIFDALASCGGIHFVLARHEQGAVHMADGYARASGRVGCCLTTSGPGATNTVTGLAAANMDGVPLVCITGQVPLTKIGNDAFQEADITGITRAVTKHNFLAQSADELPELMAEAFHIASTGKPGPVLIDIPQDVQQALTSAPLRLPSQVRLRGYSAERIADHRQIRRLAAAIDAAKRPLIYAGGGVVAGDACEELASLAHRAGIPVVTTLMGLGCFPDDDPLSLRMAGMHGSPAANRAIESCDLLISVGARFDDRITGEVSTFAPHAAIAHIDVDRSAIGKSVRVDFPLNGYARDVLRALLALVAPATRPGWRSFLRRARAEEPFENGAPRISADAKNGAPLTVDAAKNGAPLDGPGVIRCLERATGGREILVTDVGQHQIWAAQFRRHTLPRRFLTSGGFGAMGFGMPAAIGAQLACPEDLVVAVAGDGGAQMNFQELVVAVEHGLPVKTLILNNRSLGMVRQIQDSDFGGRRMASGLGFDGRQPCERIRPPTKGQPIYLPDFVRLAEAHGAKACRVATEGELEAALAKALGDGDAWVIECLIDPETNVSPAEGRGGGHSGLA